MNTFETSATLEDASHLTLHEPLPFVAGRECRVIVQFLEPDKSSPAWTAEFLKSIRIDDPKFVRPSQGELRPIQGLDHDDPA